MEISYRRDLNHNYMILENDRIEGAEYPVRMLEQNQIPELLQFQLRKLNGKVFFYYEITSRQPLSQVYETTAMKSRDIEQLLRGIRDGIEHAHQYLLSSEDILLEPDVIYMDMGTGQIQLCCAPLLGSSSGKSVVSLSEFILKRLDHGDRRAVDLGYELFDQVSRENFSLQECLNTLLRERLEEKDFCEPQNAAEGCSDNRMEDTGDWEKYTSFSENNGKDRSFGEENGKRRKRGFGEGGHRTCGNGEERRNKSCRDGEESRRNTGYGKNRERSSGGEGSEKKKGKTIILCTLIVLAVLLIFVAIVYFGRLDLTQTGGLAFLFLAVLWITYSVVEGRKEKKKKHWLEDEEDPEEEEWMEALLSDIYDESSRDRETQKKEVYGKSGREMPEMSGEMYFRQEDECGETKCLTEAEYQPFLRLASTLRSQYPDIELNRERIIVGKKKDQVDVCLKQDCISRIHAKLEKQNDSYFLTDLNSMNGSFINGERLMPNERRQLQPGDRVSFATLRYVVK